MTGYEMNQVPSGLWYDGEPSGANDETRCVQLGKNRVRQDTDPHLFVDAGCDAKIHFTCKYCHATTTTTTTYFTTTTTEAATTTTTVGATTTTTTTAEPTTIDVPDWEEYDGCYYHQGAEKKMFADAFEACADPLQDGYYEAQSASSLAVPRSEGEAMFIAGFEDRPGNPRWLGIRSDGLGGFTAINPPDSMQWDAGFTNGRYHPFYSDLWYDGEPCGENCVQRGVGKKTVDLYPWKLNDAP